VGFPDDRDRELIRKAERTEDLAIALANWLAEFNAQRLSQNLLPILESEEFELTQLRRRAASLYSSAKVPVAAAVYGPSQVGKSLFVGRVLAPSAEDYSPLGRDEQSGEPAYFQQLSFDVDLNPQSGSNEATALVTRFTTKDRISVGGAPEFPVVVRALSRAQWLRVLARGYSVECVAPDELWSQELLEELFEQLSRRYSAHDMDRQWRLDLLDAYAYMRSCDRRGFPAAEAVVNGLLARYPLSEDGYVALAARLFWNNWASLTSLFLRINGFLSQIAAPDRDPVILVHWAGVRFLLDSQRSKTHERRTSRCFSRVEWTDFQLVTRDGWTALDYRPGWHGGNEPLETIQAAMLELVIPVLPHRLSEDWRKVVEQIDILDIPGIRAGRQGAEQGKRTSADTLDEQMEIVKRGKVAYLFERYTDELQIQTLLLLARGGNLEVTAQMKSNVEKWGKARYGEAWPSRVRDELPALFIGLTGVDEEFRNRSEWPGPMLYETRLTQLVDALGTMMNDFGGRGQPFTNTYPLRYPGTWDANSQQREKEGADKWHHAGQAFLASAQVQRYVAAPELKWQAAIRDDDGGLSLISQGWREVTTAVKKQDQLALSIDEVWGRLWQLAQAWIVNPDSNSERARRLAVAQRVLDWLASDDYAVYERVHGLQQALGFRDGDQWRLADFADLPLDARVERPDSLERRFPQHLSEFLHEWATIAAPRQWEAYVAAHSAAGPWLATEDFGAFARSLRDYLCSPGVFDDICGRLLRVVGLKLRDEAARRRARRTYVRILLNDFVMNPGAVEPLIAPAADEDRNRFGLMAPFIHRWRSRLPEALAQGAGAEVRIPPGNGELVDLLASYGEENN
jgi:hypothetical protein